MPQPNNYLTAENAENAEKGYLETTIFKFLWNKKLNTSAFSVLSAVKNLIVSFLLSEKNYLSMRIARHWF
jgi:hypothetical protein